MDETEVQAYFKKHKVCETMEQLVGGLLAGQPQDPVLGAIYLLCEANGVKPPAECPKVQEKPHGVKKEEKEKKGKVDPREEALNRVAAEKEKKKRDEDQGIDFASAF